MSLTELSKCYEEAAALLRRRLHQLRFALGEAKDPEEVFQLKRRIAELTAHYYERGYWRNEKYIC